MKSDTHSWLGRSALNCRLTLSGAVQSDYPSSLGPAAFSIQGKLGMRSRLAPTPMGWTATDGRAAQLRCVGHRIAHAIGPFKPLAAASAAGEGRWNKGYLLRKLLTLWDSYAGNNRLQRVRVLTNSV